MSYQKNYPNGWQSGEAGGTPITPAALDNIENGIANALPKDGTDPMTADLPMGGHRVTGLGAPTENNDAVPLGYATDKFAPAGYGLGTTAPPLLADGNVITPARFFRVTTDTLNLGGATKYSGIVLPYNANEAVQMHVRTTNGAVRFRRTEDKGATWVSEWLNPGMAVGTEYATMERSEGKGVSSKHVCHSFSTQIGSESGSGDITIPHGITDFGRLVRIVATDWSGYQLPYFTSAGGFLAIKGVDATNITLRYNKATLAARDMYFDVYYTKK